MFNSFFYHCSRLENNTPSCIRGKTPLALLLRKYLKAIFVFHNDWKEKLLVDYPPFTCNGIGWHWYVNSFCEKWLRAHFTAFSIVNCKVEKINAYHHLCYLTTIYNSYLCYIVGILHGILLRPFLTLSMDMTFKCKQNIWHKYPIGDQPCGGKDPGLRGW
jgi:hypothetical protein